jgi:LacI family transcriptional regulator
VAPQEAFRAWLRQYRPEVLISKEQFVQPRLAELGLTVPRDIAFAEIFLDPDGQTAGVRHNCERVGELAVEILDGQLQHYSYGVPSFPTTTLVEGTWFDGKSLPLSNASSERRSHGSRGWP